MSTNNTVPLSWSNVILSNVHSSFFVSIEVSLKPLSLSQHPWISFWPSLFIGWWPVRKLLRRHRLASFIPESDSRTRHKVAFFALAQLLLPPLAQTNSWGKWAQTSVGGVFSSFLFFLFELCRSAGKTLPGAAIFFFSPPPLPSHRRMWGWKRAEEFRDGRGRGGRVDAKLLPASREGVDWLADLAAAVERKGKKQTRSGSKSSEAQNGGEPSRRQPIREPQGGSGTSNQEEIR